jgi:hypothetical protein
LCAVAAKGHRFMTGIQTMAQADASPPKATSVDRIARLTIVRFVIVGATVALLALVGLQLFRGGGGLLVASGGQ